MTSRFVWVLGLLACGLLAGCLDPLPIVVPDQGSEHGTPDGDVPMDAEPEDLGPDAPAPDLGPGITLEVGFGDPSNFMVAPGTGTATAVMGIQGGYHLDMGFRVRGLSAADFNSGDWIIAYEFRSSAGVALSEPITRILSLVGVSFDGTGQVRTGDRVFFLSSDPSANNLTTITLEVSLTNGSTTVVDTAEVTLVVP